MFGKQKVHLPAVYFAVRLETNPDMRVEWKSEVTYQDLNLPMDEFIEVIVRPALRLLARDRTARLIARRPLAEIERPSSADAPDPKPE